MKFDAKVKLLCIQNWKCGGENSIPSIEKWRHKLMYIREMEYSTTATGIKDLLICAVNITDHKGMVVGVSLTS